MKNLAVGLLKWFLFLGIIYPIYAQKDSDAKEAEGFHNIKISLVGLRRVIQEAGIIQRLEWAGISLINPDSQSKPIFLYAYGILDLTDSMNTSGDVENSDDDSESLLPIILSEAASGLVNLVVIDNHNGSYVGQVLKVLVHDDTLVQSKDFLIAWDRFRTAKKLSLEALIALSRPLRDDLFNKPDRELKLVARSGLWEPLNLHAPE